ncbi:hypothetical protein [Marinimicrobium agarilyticum]|uniref:hypothetical protein n=1 Tax=Marinimicrobium agarilyticum TaxID=306546 RepID=UPI000481FCED|nr:hypothetical protein [Marinimicrobium agarilyticum]
MALLIKKIAFISAFALGCLLLVSVLAYFFVGDVKTLLTLLEETPPIILVETFHSYTPGALIIGVGGFLYALSLFAFLYKENWYKKALPYFTCIIFIGIVAIPVGGVGISYYWHHAAKSKGYVKCSLIDKISPAKMHTSYWVKEPSLCNNKQVAKRISGTSLKGLKRANEYLEKQERLNNLSQ